MTDFAALKRLCEQATPGPWKPNVWIETDGDEWRATGPGHDRHAHDYGSEPGGPDEQAAQRDAAFICAARSALPRLLDECERLAKERDEARESEARLLARSNPLDPSGYSLADAEHILMDHHRGMSIEDRAESLKRIGETESHELRAALLSAEHDWRGAREQLAALTSDRDRLAARVAEVEGELAHTREGLALHRSAIEDVQSDRDRLRKLLGEACALAETEDWNAECSARIAEIKREGGV